MDQVKHAHDALKKLCVDIERFVQHEARAAEYRAPIIDWHHPDDYGQRGIQGIRKFLAQATTERDHVAGLLNSGVPPREFTTNAPHILAVWDEFTHAKWPLVVISQSLECGTGGVAKVDVVADGGNVWIKVNTMKESRLLAEFHEQDSYVNSDYDSDTEDDLSTEAKDPNAESPVMATGPGSLELTNSLITQATSLLRAAAAYQRPRGLPSPRVLLVLNRLEEHPPGGYNDLRIPATFTALREMGVDLRFGVPAVPAVLSPADPPLKPSRQILLDLSVLVALCCDSTHRPLPKSGEELESRFRPLRRGPAGELELDAHTNVSADLRDQLRWEMQHPLIQEMKDRLTPLVEDGEEVEFWTTQEVKGRLPGLVDLIGGPLEQSRARALFGEGDEDFWIESRWKGNEGMLKNMRARVLEDDGSCTLGLADLPSFRRGVITACQTMIDILEPPPAPLGATSLNAPTQYHPSSPSPARSAFGRGKRSKNPKRPDTVFPPTRLPSGHTLRTMLVGARLGWTVLTNNRGAVGKVCREMGVQEGLPGDWQGRTGNAAVWVVNPSSLSEWRRKEIEKGNRRLLDDVEG